MDAPALLEDLKIWSPFLRSIPRPGKYLTYRLEIYLICKEEKRRVTQGSGRRPEPGANTGT